MKDVFSKYGEYQFGLKKVEPGFLNTPMQFAEYTIIYVSSGKGVYHADFGSFPFNGPVFLFSTPLQVLYIEQETLTELSILQFHGDFYCIEYHRAEVACNGLLFNNIYLSPSISLSDADAKVFDNLLTELDIELKQETPSEIVLRAYLQLFLAKSSHIKTASIATSHKWIEKDQQMDQFREFLDLHFLTIRKPHDYAALLSMSPNNLTRRCVRYFQKTPSQLIQERLILEAKKQLHLTRHSIKEIAYSLKFKDEFYFSRFFKKVTKVSPQTFRERTGISIIADQPRG